MDRMLPYQPETWREDAYQPGDVTNQSEPWSPPNVWEQTRILALLGCINYKIIKGKRVYVEVDGVVYKTLFGGYWRSVFTGVEHYLLRCQQVSGSVWAAEDRTISAIDLPIAYSNYAWTARGQSLSLMVSSD